MTTPAAIAMAAAAAAKITPRLDFAGAAALSGERPTVVPNAPPAVVAPGDEGTAIDDGAGGPLGSIARGSDPGAEIGAGTGTACAGAAEILGGALGRATVTMPSASRSPSSAGAGSASAAGTRRLPPAVRRGGGASATLSV